MQPFYYVEASESKIRKAAHDLRDCQPVFKDKTRFLIRVSESEKGFVDKVVADLGIKIKPYGEELPPNRKLPCGKYYIEGKNLTSHTSHCRVCRISMGKPAPKPAITIAKVRGLTEMSINSLLSAMKQRYEECMDLAAEWDRAIKALEGIETLSVRTKALEQEKIEHTKTIKHFLGEIE